MERRRELQESQGLESQEELEAQGVVHNSNTNRTTLTSRRRVALHPPEAQQRETRRLRTLSPPSSSSVQTTSLPWVQEPSRFPFLSWLSSRNSSSHTRSENRRRNNNPWRSNLSDTEGRRDSRVGTQDDDFVSLDYSWLYNMDGIENEEEQRQQGRRALWRRIISRAPVYSGRNRSIRNNTSNNNNNNSDTDPADMDPEEYVYHLPSQSLGRNRPSRVYLSSATRDERQDSFLRPMQETPTNEMHRAQALDTSWVFRGEEEERDNPSWEADTTWNGTSHVAYGHQMMNETEEDLFSSESSSDQEMASRPSGTRFVVRFANRSFETTLGGREDEQEQPQSTLTNSSLLETEEEEGENVECSSSRLQFLLGSDGPEDSRTYRLVISRFGLTGLILYRNLMTCGGPFYPRSPARLLVHLAGYFLFFKDYSVVSSRAHMDPFFLSRLLSLEESEAARLFDHLKMRDPMKLLMDRLPPFFLLKRAIRGKRPFFHQGREALVIKFVLDIYVYYFQREVPLFETYRRKVLPLVQLFYTSISQSILDNVCYQQSKVLERMKWMMDWSDSNGFGLASSNHPHHHPHSGGGCEDIRDCWRKEFLFLPSRESYIEYYNHISRRLCSLTESLSISSLLV